MMNICIKLEVTSFFFFFFFEKNLFLIFLDKKNVSKKSLTLPMFDDIEKNEVFSKIFCVKLINQMDLMILCENHLNVSILASSKYDCSTDEGGVLIEKTNKRYCKGCVRNCCGKMAEFFVYKIFNYD